MEYVIFNKDTEDLLTLTVKNAVILLWDNEIRSALNSIYQSRPVFGNDLTIDLHVTIPGKTIALLLGLSREDNIRWYPDDWF